MSSVSPTTVLNELTRTLGADLLGTVEFRGETTLHLRPEALVRAAQALKAAGYTFLVDITSIDHYGEELRYEIAYEFYNFTQRTHLRLKIALSENAPQAPSLAALYPTADWHEREIFDMMGITFTGHPDLRRILMWPGYPYYPLRKDFPLEGKPSDMPGEAFSEIAPLEGGPFVTSPSDALVMDKEPRARRPMGSS